MDSCLPGVCSRASRLSSAVHSARAGPAPKHLASPLSPGRPPAGPCCPAVSLPSFCCSLAAEEAGLEDPPDTGWRLCLRLHGPLHPEGLSPDGHELPFLFEQVRLSRTHARGRPRSLNPSLSGPSLFVVMTTPGEAVLQPRPTVPHPRCLRDGARGSGADPCCLPVGSRFAAARPAAPAR